MRFKLSIPAWLSIFAIVGSFLAASLPAANAQEEPTGLEDALPTEQLAQVKIVGFGDSLMAGYLLPSNAAFPQQLEKVLDDKGYEVSIENAGVSGDTTTGGLARIDWSIPDGTDLVILELGANDALRGISPDITEKNLDEMLSRLKTRGISVILAGMMAPPNMGKDYADKFNPIYPRLAQKYGVPLYPFFLDGVATQKGLLLEDGMHPNEKGVEAMVAKFLPTIEKNLKDIQKTGTSGG
ncbi:arylesterase [Ochrobactrum sp. MYb15]|uniref:arylesterase n=1 Tax=Brucella TaxID=234 RepID=UPI000463D913|nr:arylesterase [Brucella rhizosphaerae]PQZ49127.1 arylesterase [Ochrobactrum sp. MYb19]PRA57668.1 arylesterase [Ochrobactrum sp. MYb68]PRA67055.1 arylesterase [Ochrobactrum sp. MYb18]PRA75915.1 arylesterase [Brucella thiophenivorans]PRA92066.1 arylesterase [Ochrobactrum sp. MYb14]PRA97921.1 arylesterase [Ochrobactrum sp. MYb15]